jgi:hypothetical protein
MPAPAGSQGLFKIEAEGGKIYVQTCVCDGCQMKVTIESPVFTKWVCARCNSYLRMTKEEKV